MYYILVFALFTAAECQYFSLPGFRPDITFSEDNDWFDVKPLINLQKKYHNSLHSRRSRHQELPTDRSTKTEWIILKGDKAEAKNKLVKMMTYVKNNINKEMDNIAELLNHDWKRSRGAGDEDQDRIDADVDDFASRKSLDNMFVKLGGGRRSAGTAHFLTYAFPIQMIFRGYLLPPTITK